MIFLYTIFVHPVSSNNPTNNCSGILLSSYKDSCILNLAENQSSPYLCEQLPSSLANQCYFYIAQSTLNDTLCYKSGSFYSQSCTNYIAIKTNNPSLCSKLISGNATECAVKLAIENNNSSICNYITNTSENLMCYSSLNLSLAYKTKNLSYCSIMSPVKNNTISNNIIYYSGLNSLENTSNSNIFYVSPFSYIESLQNISYSPKNICYIAISLSSKNSSYCKLIKNQTLSSLCISSSYYLKNNTKTNNTLIGNNSNLNISKEFLKKFNYSSILDSCLNYSSSSNINPFGCNYTISIIKAITAQNVSYCPNNNITYSYQCYYLLAKTLNQTKYCSYILNATENNACYQTITNNISNT
ncbi:MAG: hypothetical protein QXD23_01250 [Candidatus Micrarchaeaceae archaeon]